ncbi:flagellar filament cap protein [Citrobacter freundii]|nr:flagellar filament cap protein [Citrobacter freundii]
MAEIGIAQDGTTGKLKIDDDKLAKALKENTASVRELLVGDGKETGITTKIATEVKGYLADDGIIDNAQDNINATLKSLTKQYLSVSNSIDETVARYKGPVYPTRYHDEQAQQHQFLSKPTIFSHEQFLITRGKHVYRERYQSLCTGQHREWRNERQPASADRNVVWMARTAPWCALACLCNRVISSPKVKH